MAAGSEGHDHGAVAVDRTGGWRRPTRPIVQLVLRPRYEHHAGDAAPRWRHRCWSGHRRPPGVHHRRLTRLGTPPRPRGWFRCRNAPGDDENLGSRLSLEEQEADLLVRDDHTRGAAFAMMSHMAALATHRSDRIRRHRDPAALPGMGARLLHRAPRRAPDVRGERVPQPTVHSPTPPDDRCAVGRVAPPLVATRSGRSN